MNNLFCLRTFDYVMSKYTLILLLVKHTVKSANTELIGTMTSMFLKTGVSYKRTLN